MNFVRLVCAALAAVCIASGALAQGATAPSLTDPVAPVTAADPGMVVAPAPYVPAPKQPWLVFSIRGGIDTAPPYFSSDELVVWHDWHLKVEYLRLGTHHVTGHPEPRKERYGFNLRPQFRLINGRDPTQYPELAGTFYVFPSLEVGMGVGYTRRRYAVYADARYGLFGHESWDGEVGGHYRMYPTDALELWIGPRFYFGTNSYADKWYGVTAQEAAYSGLPAFDPSPGLLRVGVEFGANLDIHEKWDFEAAFTYDKLVNGAANSPITALGSEEQLAGRIGFTRRFTLR